MEMFLMYLKAFAVGGAICVLGQILINYTKMTSGRILVMFVLLGVLLQSFGLYQYVIDFAGAGGSVPIVGFGHALANGAIEGAKTGFLGSIIGGFKAGAIGITAAIIFGYLNALIFTSRTKTR